MGSVGGILRVLKGLNLPDWASDRLGEISYEVYKGGTMAQLLALLGSWLEIQPKATSEFTDWRQRTCNSTARHLWQPVR